MSRAIAPLLALLGLRAPGLAAADGVAACPCINPYTHSSLSGASGIVQYLSGGSLRREIPGSSVVYTYPANYGNGCSAHDNGLPPSCTTDTRPSWCQVPWCYVDPSDCDGVTKVRTKYFPDVANLYFSYQTCSTDGASAGSSGADWTQQDVQLTKRLFALADNYAGGARTAVEAVKAPGDGNDNVSESDYACELTSDRQMCPCTDCFTSTVWAGKVDFERVGMLRDEGRGTEKEKGIAACMSQRVETQYKAIAAREMDPDFSKVGYMYFADQSTGGYTQWPREEACTWTGGDGGSYDPRYRPWYAGGATGPKDVVLVVDVSGSMSRFGRSTMAKAATKRVLDTLTWKDFASIVLFNGGVYSVYSKSLVPMTEANLAAMKSWADGESWEQGQTNFQAAMREAFDIIDRSVLDGDTSMCQKAILFLTDGQADFTDADFRMVKQKSIQYDTVVFSYALGDAADHVVPKRLACENRGIFYPVPDAAAGGTAPAGRSLPEVMADYYNYYVQGQEICTTTFVRYTSTQGHQLYGACMPMYDRASTGSSLLGVSCLDVNLIAPIEDMQEEAGWEHFKCQASDSTKMCRALGLTDCRLQQLRRQYSEESVCEDQPFADISLDASCPCQEATCQDDPTFIDEKGYFCDTWVGDDCISIDPKWGYSDAGGRAIRDKCKRSCGLCPWIEECAPDPSGECPSRPVFDECRACLGKVSGVDIDGEPMTCPRSDSGPGTTTTKSANDAHRGQMPGALRWLLVSGMLTLAARRRG